MFWWIAKARSAKQSGIIWGKRPFATQNYGINIAQK